MSDIKGEKPLSPSHQEARDALPDVLRPVFDALVEDYKFAAVMHHRSPFVSYKVLADLVRGGWRLLPEADE